MAGYFKTKFDFIEPSIDDYEEIEFFYMHKGEKYEDSNIITCDLITNHVWRYFRILNKKIRKMFYTMIVQRPECLPSWREVVRYMPKGDKNDIKIRLFNEIHLYPDYFFKEDPNRLSYYEKAMNEAEENFNRLLRKYFKRDLYYEISNLLLTFCKYLDWDENTLEFLTCIYWVFDGTQDWIWTKDQAFLLIEYFGVQIGGIVKTLNFKGADWYDRDELDFFHMWDFLYYFTTSKDLIQSAVRCRIQDYSRLFLFTTQLSGSEKLMTGLL